MKNLIRSIHLNLNKSLCLTYGSAFLIYTVLFFGLMFKIIFLHEVIAPTRGYVEIAASQNHAVSKTIETPRFGDYSGSYIPEIKMLLQGPRSGWLTLWTNQNELGRPLYHLAGFSPAYPPSWVIAMFTQDPWKFITFLSLLTCFLSGIFILLFCQEVRLHPLAGLIAGTCLATAPLLMYWLTFPMFLAIWCWAAGALWALTRLAKRMDLIAWSALSFSIYSLLITAYPQAVVFHAYIFLGYGLYLSYQKQKRGSREVLRFWALSISAIVIAIVLTLPVYWDLASIRAASARVAPDPSFFTFVLPSLNSLDDVWRFLTLSTLPELLGNPIKTTYPFAYEGFSLAPIAVFSLIIALLTSFKKTWGWWLAIIVFGLFAFIHPLYILGIKYLGFNLSRSTPFRAMPLLFAIIIAYGMDALLKRTHPIRISRTVLFATLILLFILISGTAFSLHEKLHFHKSFIISYLIIIALLASQYKKSYSILLITALIIGMIKVSYPLILHQDPEQIVKTSTFLEKVRENLPPDSRFAIISPGLSALLPNYNATFGLPSVHSYNSLSSRQYQHLISELGGEIQVYGRWNANILPNYNIDTFWISNIGLVLSPLKLRSNNLSYQGEDSHVYFYKVISRMGESLQLIVPSRYPYGNSIRIPHMKSLTKYIPLKQLDQGDVLEFKVTPTIASIFILSQKFYADWHAQALTPSGWKPAKTILINGVFEGVLLPENTQRVRLEFKPMARFSWIAHVFWIGLLMLVLARTYFNHCPLSKRKL